MPSGRSEPGEPGDRDAILTSIIYAESEASFQAKVITLARLTHWRVYHTHDARHSAAGWPDLALCKPPRLLLVELKREGKDATVAQRAWLADLAACPGVEVALWRPSDWSQIERTLAHGELVSRRS